MRPATTAWIANVRANAAPPGTLIATIVGKSGSLAIATNNARDQMLS